MSLSDTFIKRPVLSTVISLLILMMGAITLPGLPIETLPNIGPPTIQVTTTFPGADALTVEKTVTAPLEEQINGAPGMDYIMSNSDNEGNIVINVFFKPGVDIIGAQTNVLNRVQTALAELPEAVNHQGVTVEATSNTFQLVYTVSSPSEEYDTSYINGLINDNLIYPLSRSAGVAQATLLGAAPPAFRLWINPYKMVRYNLTIDKVIASIKTNNNVLVGGTLGNLPAKSPKSTSYPIIINGNIETVDKFNEMPISKTPNGSIIQLRDIGRAEYGMNNYNFNALNITTGAPSVAFGIVPLPGSNQLVTSAAALKVIKQFESTLPTGIELKKVYDTSDYVNASIGNAITSLADALVLVLLIIYIFLQDWRATMIPAIALPISLLGAMTFLGIAHFSINELTLLGVILATGLVVDDAIVVVEAVTERIEAGEKPFEAASKAMDTLTAPIIATALVLLSIFLPVSFFPGPTGIIYRQFALTIVFAILISTSDAITGKPLQAAILMSGNRNQPSDKTMRLILPALLGSYGFWRGGIIPSLVLGSIAFICGNNLTSVFAKFNEYFGFLAEKYLYFLKITLTRSKRISYALIGATVLTGIIFAVAPSGFVPDEDQDYIMGIIQLPPQASLQATTNVSKQVQEIMSKSKIITSGMIVPGSGFNGDAPFQAMFHAGLLPINQRPGYNLSAQHLIKQLNTDFAKIKGATVVAQMPPAVNGYSAQGGLQYQFNDLSNGEISPTNLLIMANKLIKNAYSTGQYSSLYTQFISDAPAWKLEMDRSRLESLDIDYTTAANTVGTLLGGLFVNPTYEGIEYRQVYVQAEGDTRSDPSDLKGYYVPNRSGEQVPLPNIASLKLDSSPPIINHFNLNRTVLIQGSPALGASSNGLLTQLVKSFNSFNFPQIGMEFSGLSRAQVAVGSSTIIVFGLGIIVAYLILSAQYGSYSDPIITLATVPLGILGAILFLLSRGLDNNIYAQVGILTLVGLAAKNGILIVDMANQIYNTGVSAVDSVVAATKSRFRPILMTSSAALSGFFPLVIATGASQISQRSLGAVIFGGLLVSTFTSLFIVPAVYVTIKNLVGRKEVPKAG